MIYERKQPHMPFMRLRFFYLFFAVLNLSVHLGKFLTWRMFNSVNWITVRTSSSFPCRGWGRSFVGNQSERSGRGLMRSGLPETDELRLKKEHPESEREQKRGQKKFKHVKHRIYTHSQCTSNTVATVNSAVPHVVLSNHNIDSPARLR